MDMHFVLAPTDPGTIWDMLERVLQLEPHIMGSRITSVKLHDLYEQGLAVVGLLGDRPVGFIAAWPVETGFVEVGSAWIHPEHRGKGWGTQLVQEMANLMTRRTERAFAVSDNAVFVAAARKVRLPLHNEWDDPIPYSLTCGPCEKRPGKEAKCACPIRNTACRLVLFPAP